MSFTLDELLRKVIYPSRLLFWLSNTPRNPFVPRTITFLNGSIRLIHNHTSPHFTTLPIRTTLNIFVSRYNDRNLKTVLSQSRSHHSLHSRFLQSRLLRSTFHPKAFGSPTLLQDQNQRPFASNARNLYRSPLRDT